MADIIKFKRGKSTTWKTKNLLLLDGEPGFEVDTFRLKIGDGKTQWNDLPYVGKNGDVVLPDNVMYYLGNINTLPDSATEGSTAIYKNKLYIFSNGTWVSLATENVEEPTIFDSLVDAINYISNTNYVGKIVSVKQNNKMLPYIVNIDSNLIPIQYGEDSYDILNGGNANTLN